MFFIWIIWIILTIYLFFIRRTNHYIIIPIEGLNENILDEVLIDTNSQNVHDPVVRSIGSEKYFYLRSKIETEYKYLGRGWLQTLKNATMNELKNHKEFFELYQALQQNETFILSPSPSFSLCEKEEREGEKEKSEKEVKEQEIFTLVWIAFKKLDNKILITQLRDCYEDGHLVCLNGRIARYLTAFVGVTDDILGKPEVTEKILFEEALRETKNIFWDILEKSTFKKIYVSGGTDKEEEQLDAELLKIKSRIKRRLSRTYPLSEKKINEILMAL